MALSGSISGAPARAPALQHSVTVQFRSLAFVIAAVLIVAPWTAVADDVTPTKGGQGLFHKGSVHTALVAGYGLGFPDVT